MAVEMKKVILFARKGLLVSIRASYKFTKDHPFISGFVFFVLSLYRYFPSLFAFLVSSSPVIFCTAFLLGLLLSYGEPNIPEVDKEEKKTREIRSLKATCAADDLVFKKDEIFAVETHVEQRREINEDPIEAAMLIEGDVNASGNVESYAYSVISHDDGERQDDALTASSSLFKEDEKEIHGEKKVDEDDYQGQVVYREFSAANSDQILFADGEDVIHSPSIGQSEFEAPQIKMDEPALGNHFASSLGSPYQHIERHDASSDSESDGAESSSPDASMADILPMLDELHPLLYSEHPQHAHKDIDNSDAASQSSSDKSDSFDSQAEEEAENQGQAEDERQEERDDAIEVAVKWTADDQKNIMDLGILELERNQRLENLIAKRRARKRLEAERNRINLDINDIDPVMQQLRGLHIETRPIRRNPFDLPDDSEESMGLPPIPGSAPSVLLPRWNPFDFPDDPIGETGGLTSQKMSHRKEFAPLSHRETFFQKHDSFSKEPLFSGDSTQEKHTSRFRPAESMDSDQSDYATLQRHISANSDSKVNSVPEFDSVSSVDQETKELAKQVYYDQSELLGPVDHRGEPSDLGSQSSEKLDPVDGKQEPGGINMVEDNRIGSDTAGAIEGAFPIVGAVDEESRHNDLPKLLVSEADHLHEIKEKFNDSSSSSSSEVTDKVLDMSINEVSATVEQVRTDSLGDSRDSTQSAILDYDNVSGKVERLDESQIANCTFYSSPSATEESLYNVAALNSELFFGGKEGSYSSSLASDLQVEISEVGSPPRPTEMNIISEGGAFVFNHKSTGEDSTSGSQDISVNFSEENESVPREESIIREHDVIRMVYPEADTDFSDSVISMVPEPAAVQLVHRPNLSSAVNGQKDSPVDVEASLERDLNESINSTSYPEERECLRNPTERIDLEEFQPSILDLPPIPENLHESVLEQEHDSSEEPAPIVSFTGMKLFEEYNVDLYDLQEALSSPQPQSPKENRTDVNSKSLFYELEKSDAPISSPGVSFSDSSFSGLHAVNQSEIRDDSETRCSSGSICSEKESAEVHNELKDLKEIDEDLLSELDVVGDFYPAKPTVNQELSGMELPFVSDGIGRVESCEDSSLEVSHLSSKLPAETMDETKLVVDQPTLSILKMDPEQTVYKSKLHVLEAFPHEDIGLVPDQLVEGAALPSAAMVEKHITTNPEVGSSGSDASDKDQEPSGTNSELLVLGAKSIDDINLAFKQLSQSDPDNLVHPEAGPSEILSCKIHTELMDVQSDMQIVEATSLEDIHLAMKQLSSSLVENPNKSIESKDESSEVMDSQIHLEEEAVTDLDVKRADSELVGTHSELQVVEATSFEDIHLAMKQLSAGMVIDPNKSIQGADESSIAEASQMHLEPEVVRHANAEKVNSELLVLEAKSIEDISSAFKQLHGDFFDKSVYSEVQPSEALLDRVYAEPVETHSDLLVLRQQSEVQTPAGQLESEVLELQSIQETEAASRTEHAKDSTEV